MIVMRPCPQHGLVTHWVEAWIDPDNRHRGREYRCVLERIDERGAFCDLILGRPIEYVALESALTAVKKAASRTSTPRLIRDQVERELKRRPKKGRP